MLALARQIYETFEDPGFSAFAKYYSIGMMLLIVLATTCFVLESEATVAGGTLYDEEQSALRVFQQIELYSVIIFTVEYVLRLCCCPCGNWGAVRFVFSTANIIDLLAIMPFWVTQVIVAMNPGVSAGGFGFLRVVRLVRVFRVFKFGKYSHGLAMMAGAITKSSQPLSILAFSVMLATIILSSIMYMFEGDLGNIASPGFNQKLLDDTGFSSEGHLYCFGTIPRCFWWSFVTMTTVGYGDCYPISVLGKMLAMLTAVLGVLILALPITVVGSNFQKLVEMYDEESSTMREFDASEDGNIDLDELRSFIAAKRKDNVLRKEVDLNPVRLMAKYDPQGNGTLSFEEFAVLKRDIIDPAAADPQANMRLLLKRVTDNDKGLMLIREQLNRIEKLLEGREGGGADADAPSATLVPKLPPLPNPPGSPGREETPAAAP